MNYRPTVAVVDLGQIAENFKKLKGAAAPGTFACPMVKANAYGHGAHAVTKKLRDVGATHVGIVTIEEALKLRKGGDTGAILDFGMFDRAGADVMVENGITSVLSSREGLEDLIRAAETLKSRNLLKEPIGFHVEVNTGMNRLGVSANEVMNLAKRIVEVSGVIAGGKNLIRLEGLCTHFSDGEDFGVGGGRTEEQMRRFRKAERDLRQAGLDGFKLHVANSSATVSLAALTEKKDSSTSDLGIRPGIALYGVNPEVPNSATVGVKPALRWISRIALVQDVRQGERVSYGGRWTATRDSRIGVIPCGYADGYRRGINSQATGPSASVLINGRRVPVLGTICMDYFMIDLTDVQAARQGEEVTLLGESNGVSITANELAERVQTISYEIFTGISERVPRVYVDGGASVSVVS